MRRPWGVGARNGTRSKVQYWWCLRAPAPAFPKPSATDIYIPALVFSCLFCTRSGRAMGYQLHSSFVVVAGACLFLHEAALHAQSCGNGESWSLSVGTSRTCCASSNANIYEYTTDGGSHNDNYHVRVTGSSLASGRYYSASSCQVSDNGDDCDGAACVSAYNNDCRSGRVDTGTTQRLCLEVACENWYANCDISSVDVTFSSSSSTPSGTLSAGDSCSSSSQCPSSSYCRGGSCCGASNNGECMCAQVARQRAYPRGASCVAAASSGKRPSRRVISTRACVYGELSCSSHARSAS